MMAERGAPLGVVVIAILVIGCASTAPPEVLEQVNRFDRVVVFDQPDLAGEESLEAALARRRSIRDFTRTEVPVDVLGQLLWAGQGVTDDDGHRTAPSAGARYPIELYAITPDEVMHYRPEAHQVDVRSDPRVLPALADLAFGQEFVSKAPLVLAVVAVPARTAAEYGAVAEALVDREAGHVAQNILLQATVLDLASVPVGGFDPPSVAERLALPPGHDVRYLIPIG